MNKDNWPHQISRKNEEFSQNIQWPKISIVTPSFNQGQFIEETILSILNQNYPNLEYIIIDGGSTDDTVDIIKKYEDRISYWVSEKDGGQTDAINKGFDLANGDIYAFLNSDDCYYDGALYKIAKCYLEQNDKKDDFLIIGNCYWAKEFSDLKGWLDIPKFPNNLKQALIQRGLAPQPAMFWTKNKQNLKFYSQLQFCMDFEFWLQLILHDYKVLRVDFSIALFRQHGLSKTTNLTNILNQELNGLSIIYAKHLKSADELEIRNFVMWSEQIEQAKTLTSLTNRYSFLSRLVKALTANITIYLKIKVLISIIFRINIIK